MTALVLRGGRRGRQDAASGIYLTARSVGFLVGTAVGRWRFGTRTQFDWSLLVQDMASAPYGGRGLAAPPLGQGSLDPATAQLAGEIDRQAQMLAFQDGLAPAGWTAFVMLTFAALIQMPKLGLKTGAAH